MTLWVQFRNAIALRIACVSHGLMPTKSPRPHARTGILINYNVQKPFLPVTRCSPHVNHVFKNTNIFQQSCRLAADFEFFGRRKRGRLGPLFTAPWTSKGRQFDFFELIK